MFTCVYFRGCLSLWAAVVCVCVCACVCMRLCVYESPQCTIGVTVDHRYLLQYLTFCCFSSIVLTYSTFCLWANIFQTLFIYFVVTEKWFLSCFFFYLFIFFNFIYFLFLFSLVQQSKRCQHQQARWALQGLHSTLDLFCIQRHFCSTCITHFNFINGPGRKACQRHIC